MNPLSFIAPVQNDREFVAQTIKELTPDNAEESCHNISSILAGASISREDLVPILEKAQKIIKSGNSDSAATIFFLFYRSKSTYFTSKDLCPIMDMLMNSPNALSPPCISSFLGLCSRALENSKDLSDLTSEPLKLTQFAKNLRSDPSIAGFFIRAAQLEPSIRVPLVFAGLIEEILPYLSSRGEYFSLLASLARESQVKKYILDMGYIPAISSSVVSSNYSDLSIEFIESLLSSDDLNFLPLIQKNLKDIGVIDLLFTNVISEASSTTLIASSCLYLTNCVKYNSFLESDSQASQALKAAALHPMLCKQFLMLFEAFSCGSNRFFPKDNLEKEFPVLFSNTFFRYFFSFLSFQCRKTSFINLDQSQSLAGNERLLMMACAVQRRILIGNSETLSQDPSDPDLQAMACLDCLVCGKEVGNRGRMVQSCVDFFYRNGEAVLSSKNSSRFFPQSFIDWGKSSFGEVSQMKWLAQTKAKRGLSSQSIFSRSDEESRKQIQELSMKADEALKKKNALLLDIRSAEAEISKLNEKCEILEGSLVSARARQIESIRTCNSMKPIDHF